MTVSHDIRMNVAQFCLFCQDFGETVIDIRAGIANLSHCKFTKISRLN